VTGVLAVHVIHENPEWYPPLAAAFDAASVPHRDWLVGTGQPGAGLLDLTWLEAHGRRVVNGRRVLDLEMSKAEQLSRLRAAGLDVPRTVAVAADSDLAKAASLLPVPFISKHNQGGKGASVRLFVSHDEYAAYLSGPDYLPSPDGIILLQEYLWPAESHITRVEIVGGEFVYAITADTDRGGFELCPADGCAPGEDQQSIFALREGFSHPVIRRYEDFARRRPPPRAARGRPVLPAPARRVLTPRELPESLTAGTGSGGPGPAYYGGNKCARHGRYHPQLSSRRQSVRARRPPP
jgi:hypothetical protein